MVKNKKETDRLYYLEHKEQILERRRQRYKENKEKELENSKKYYEEHKDKISEYNKQYNTTNNEKLKKYKKDYYNTKHGRAMRLAYHYMSEDLNHSRGESTLMPEWIVDNIFSGQNCHYCGETDWTKLGCDRKDNDKPHTPDNVVCCCAECNKKKGTTPYEEYIKMLGEKNS